MKSTAGGVNRVSRHWGPGAVITIGLLFSIAVVASNTPDLSQQGYRSTDKPLTFSGREWFVSPGKKGTGTEALPFGSIQAALDIAGPGDGITILPGTYQESLFTRRDGSREKPILVQARDGRGSVFVNVNGRALTVNHAHNHFSQLVFSGQYGDRDLIKVRTAADGWVLHNSEVRETSRDCIDIDSPSNIVIRESTIHHCLNPANGRKDAHGIVGGAVQGFLIKNTQVHSFSGDAFQIDPDRAAPGWNDVVIEGCDFWLEPLNTATNGFPAGVVPGENAIDTKVRKGYRPRLTITDSTFHGYQNGLIKNMAALNLKGAVSAVIDGVTVYNSDIAFRLRYPAEVQIVNALVYASNRAIRYEDGIAQVTIWNSTFGREINTLFDEAGSRNSVFDIQNTLLMSRRFPKEAGSGSNLLVTERDFLDSQSHDYTLTEQSIAIDSALDLGVSTDRDGTKRPLGSGFDMGAFESQ